MAALNRLLPASVRNEHPGPRFTLWVFVALSLVMLGRSLVHLLADDAGLNRIATLVRFDPAPGGPDPNEAIYMFGSMWGLHQALLAGLYLVVAARYRALVPLMYLTLVLEWAGRILVGSVLHPLGPAYFEQTPPGVRGNLPILLLSAAMLAITLWHGDDTPAEEAEA